jgi:hypothetical protein
MAAIERRWSARVMRTSNALDLERRIFTKRSPRAIAQSLKRSARAQQTIIEIAASRAGARQRGAEEALWPRAGREGKEITCPKNAR